MLRTICSLAVICVGIVLTAGQCQADYTLLVADFGSSQIYQVDPAGNITTFATVGVDQPIGVGVNTAAQNDVYVVNNGTSAGLINTVSRYSSDGTYLGSFGSGQLNAPTAIAFDATGNVYVAGANNTINEYSATGSFIRLFANTGLQFPYGMTFDSSGNLYVANYSAPGLNPSAGAIEKFSPSGADLGVFIPAGTPGTDASLDGPDNVIIDSNGHFLVSNSSLGTGFVIDKITEYDSNGNFIKIFASGANTSLSGPYGLAYGNSTGYLYVSNFFNGKIVRFDPVTGAEIDTFAQGFSGPQGIAFLPTAVPEPTSLLLVGLGFSGVLIYNHRRRSRVISAE